MHDDRTKSFIVAMVCSDPPEGFDRWTLELIREEALAKDLASISKESIRLILQEHDLKPWRQASWCVAELDAEFIERMEAVLALYERAPSPSRPLICLDEKPVQLLDEVRPASGLSQGHPRRVDYEYKRQGTCNVFCAVEPHRGQYYVKVTPNRKGAQFARFLAELEKQYEDAEGIDLVMDNLNIHKEKWLIEEYGEQEGSRIWNRFTIQYTPKHGSWLNQAEIAINMYARQCLGKSRIPSIELLTKKSRAWQRVVNQKAVTIKWQFTRNDARQKFDYG